MLAVGRNSYLHRWGKPDEVIDLVVGHKAMTPTIDGLWDFWECILEARAKPGKSVRWKEGQVEVHCLNDVFSMRVNRGQSCWVSSLHPATLAPFMASLQSLCERCEPFEIEERRRASILPMRCVSPVSTQRVYAAAWDFLAARKVVTGGLPADALLQIQAASCTEGVVCRHNFRR